MRSVATRSRLPAPWSYPGSDISSVWVGLSPLICLTERRPPIRDSHSNWIQIQSRSRIDHSSGIRFLAREGRPSLSKASHMLGAKVQLGCVLIVGAAAQMDIGERMFPAASPGHLMVKLQKVSGSALAPLLRHVGALPLIPCPHRTPNRGRDRPRRHLRGSVGRGGGRVRLWRLGRAGGGARAGLLLADLLEQHVNRPPHDLRHVPIRNLMAESLEEPHRVVLPPQSGLVGSTRRSSTYLAPQPIAASGPAAPRSSHRPSACGPQSTA